MNSSQKDRLVFREKTAQDLGCILGQPLSYRAAKFAAQHKTRDELVKWLNHPNTRNCWQMGKKTYTELCLAFGLAVPAKAPRTLGAQLAKAHQRIAELEQELAHFMELHGRIALPPETRITVNGKTFTLGEIDKEMTK